MITSNLLSYLGEVYIVDGEEYLIISRKFFREEVGHNDR